MLLGVLQKHRLLLTALALLSYAGLVAVAVNPTGRYALARADYLAWATAGLVIAAAASDLYRYRRYSIASTLALELASLVTAAVSRAAAVAAAKPVISPETPVIGGCVPDTGALAATVAALGFSVLLLAPVMLLHAVRGEPLAIAETGYTPERLWAALVGALARARDEAAEHPFTTGFIVGALVRAVPEIRWWPWPIGYDTIEYIACLRDYTTDPNPFRPLFWLSGPRYVPPLLNMVLYPFTLIADPWYIFKVYPVIAYGLLIGVTAYTVKKLFNPRGTMLLAAIVVSSLNMLVLKLSYEVFRQLLATIVFTGALLLLEEKRGSRRPVDHVLPAAVLILSALAHEITAVLAILMAGLAIAYIVYRRRQIGGLMRTIMLAVPYVIVIPVSLALLNLYATRFPGYYWTHPVIEVRPPGVTLYRKPSTVAGDVVAFILAGYGVYIPFVLASFERFLARRPFYMATPGILLAAGVSPLIAPYTAAVSWHRMLIGAAPWIIPVSTLMMDRLFRRRLYAALLIAIAIAPGAFMALHPLGSVYTGKYVLSLTMIPPELSPPAYSTVYLEDLMRLSEFVSSLELNKTAPILVGVAVSRWVHLGVRNPSRDWFKLTYAPSLAIACAVMRHSNTTRIYIATQLTPDDLREGFEDYLEQLRAYNKTPACGPFVGGFNITIRVLKPGIYKVYLVEVSSSENVTVAVVDRGG